MKKILAGLFTIMLSLGIAFGASENAHAAEKNCIAAVGVAHTETEPDMATLYGYIEEKGSSAENARELLAQKAGKIKLAYLGQGILAKDIKNTNYSLQPEYHYTKDGKQKLLGYVGRMDYRVLVKSLDKLSEAMDRSVDNGMYINHVEFGLQNKEAVKSRLLAEAVNNAKLQAGAVAAAGGRTLGTLVSADLGEVRGMARDIRYNAPMQKAALGAMETATPTMVDGGTLYIETRVSVVFGLL